MRIYELAKELGVTNKDIITKLLELGVVAKSHASSLTPEQSRALVKFYKPEVLEQMRADMPPSPAPVRATPAPAPAAKPDKPEPKPAPAHGRGKPRSHAHREAKAEPEQEKAPSEPQAPAATIIVLRDGITVKELAEKMKLSSAEMIKACLKLGVMVSINQRMNLEVAELVVAEFGFEARREELFKSAELSQTTPDRTYASVPRPPVVTIMGHVDHGKTLLLDTIRRANVVAGEAGGITQHIGAYRVELPNGKITFLDTPGHQAFTAMRARGASVTDIVILVVAADDGIMPQTEEAIHHAQAASVPIIVAINKSDLPAAQPDRVKKQLADRNLAPEEWGGSTITVEVSAKTGKNVDKLLEMILLQAEVMELKAPLDAPAQGLVIEARLDKARGPMGTILVRQGVLKVGDSFVCGHSSGKVRALVGHDGKRFNEASPSVPAVVLGFNEMPEVGDVLQQTADEKEARYIAEQRSSVRRADTLQKGVRATLEDLQKQIDGTTAKELRLVVKSDVVGSAEAIRDALEHIRDERVSLRILHSSVGAINDSDVNLAVASDAIIVGFGVRAIPTADAIAKRAGIEIRYYDIIYKLVEDITLALQGLLAPTLKETVIGQAEVRDTFKISKLGTIAGCYIRDGSIKRNAGVRLIRDGSVVYTGKIGSLRRFKEDVREVGVNFECGIGIENFNDVKVGDVIEAFTVTQTAQTLEK